MPLGEGLFQRFVKRSSDERLERVVGSERGLRVVFGTMVRAYRPEVMAGWSRLGGGETSCNSAGPIGSTDSGAKNGSTDPTNPSKNGTPAASIARSSTRS